MWMSLIIAHSCFLGLSYVVWKGLLWSKSKTWNELIFGRQTFFCCWPHHSTRAEMTCMPLHKPWQMNLLWPMDPHRYQSRDDWADEPSSADGPTLVPEKRWLAYHYTKLGRWTYFGQWPPTTRAKMTWQTNLLLLMAPPQYQSRDDLHATTQNLADEPTLADGPPSTRVEIPWIPVHKTWQMNLLWPMDPPGTRAEMPWIPVHKTWQMNLLWPMDPPR